MTTATATNLTATIDRKMFLDALAACSKAIRSRSPKPSLACVLIEGDDGEIRVTGTDLEKTIRMVVRSVDIGEPGSALIPADRLHRVLGGFTGATFTLAVDGEKAKLADDNATASIFGMPVSEYPPVATIQSDRSFTINAESLSTMLRAVMDATSKELARYAINGVYFTAEGGKLSLVTTDGHRLHICRSGVAVDDPKAILSNDGVRLLASLCNEDEGDVEIEFSDNRMRATGSEWTLWAMLVEASFPPYLDIIPKSHEIHCDLPSDEALWAMSLASTMTNEESRAVRIEFSPDGAAVSGRAVEAGEACAHCSVYDYIGDAITIGLNPTYVMDAIKALNAERVRVDMTNPRTPPTFSAGDALCVVMPVNFK